MEMNGEWNKDEYVLFRFFAAPDAVTAEAITNGIEVTTKASSNGNGIVFILIFVLIELIDERTVQIPPISLDFNDERV